MTVTAVLGGEKELGQKVKSRIDFDALIKKGMPSGVISYIKKAFDLPDEVIARIIGVSPRTVARRRKTVKIPAGERLSSNESDRVYRFARIVAAAEEVFGDKKEAMEWLNSPWSG
ncbi:MAG: antitoxin Xre-like helix-turn-helix domain-containing protein [Candidatus Geothermincolia bacterium]